VRVPAGLKTLGEIAHPQTMKNLHSAGALGPTSPIALTAAMPWLIGRGPSLGILSQMNAFQVGKKPALHDRWGTISWRRLDRLANRLGRALTDSGLVTGDRVALLLRNGREFAAALLATQKFGLVACPMNTWARPKELSAALKNADPRAILYDRAHTGQLRESMDTEALLISAGIVADELKGSVSIEDFVAGVDDRPPFPFASNKGGARVIIHTSGTTGMPKGAKRDASAIGISVIANLMSVVPLNRADVWLCPAPMFHSFGLATFAFATALGATLITPERFDAEESLRYIEEHGATAASLVPIMVRRIVDLGDDVLKRYDLSTLRILLASGSAMSPSLRDSARRAFGDVLYDLYGSTEVGWVSVASPEDIRIRPTTIGRPVPGIDVAILDATGNRVEPGVGGEMFVKSGVLFEGYTSGEGRLMVDGYVSIGDTGRVDEDGYLYIEGRSDDMVVIGGENVYPIEVEDVLESIGGVLEAAVVAVPDEEFGHVLAAFVVGDVDADVARKRCAEQLASYKVPRLIKLVESLPRTGSGKVVKRELLEQLAMVD
jgi:fatty-acyl-CoA synthase